MYVSITHTRQHGAPQVNLGGLDVAVFTEMSDVDAAWATLEQEGHVTFYQTRAWCRAWLRTLGQARGVKPLFVRVNHPQGGPCALLLFQMTRRFGLTSVEWLTAPECGYGSPLFASAFLQAGAASWFAEHFSRILEMLPRHHVVYLRSIPRTVETAAHPLAPLFTIGAANTSYVLDLDTDYGQLLVRQRGSEARRSMRKRDARLEAMGDVRFFTPTEREERHAHISTMFAYQEKRLAERGILHVFGPLEREFIHALDDERQDGRPVLALFVLTLDGVPLSILLGGRHRGQFTALISALSPGAARKHSPGDYALRHMIEALCNDHVRVMDLSAGTSRYKLHWSSRPQPMHHIVRGRSLPGIAAAALLLAFHFAKRVVKQNPAVFGAITRMRQALRGRHYEN